MEFKTGKKKHKAAMLAATLAGVLSLGQSANAAELGASSDTIKLAINEWTGQHITTRIAGSVLEKLGYSVEYVTAGNYPQHTALGDGSLHASLEVWDNNSGEIYPKMKESGKIVDIGPLGLDAGEGWLYPKHMEELCPGLPDWKALIDCKDKMATADTFPKGRVLSYPADWGTRSADIIEGLGLDYKAIPAGSEGALVAELKAAAAAKKPLVMMFWAPHWSLAEVETEWVKLPEFDPACATDASWGSNPDAVNDCGPPVPVTYKVAWAGFEEKWPAAWKFLQNYTMDTAQQQQMMKSVDQEGNKLDDVISKWMSDNESTWGTWVETAKN